MIGLWAGDAAADPRFPVRSCVNVGNALEAPEEGDWGYVIEERHLDTVAKAGFDAIRLPVRWSAHAMEEPPYLIDFGFRDRVDEVIAMAMDKGLAVIINIHHYHDFIKNPESHRERFLGIWEQLAVHYRNHPSSLYFEVLNEPMGDFKGERLHRMQREAIVRIRKFDEARTLIIGGESWNSLEGLTLLPDYEDRNTVATFHYYQPHEFTHQGAEFLEDIPEEGREWGSGEDLAKLRADAATAKAQSLRLGRPVLLGEFGVYKDVPTKKRLRYYEAVRKTFEEQGISWCAWNLSDNFAIWDKTKNRLMPGMKKALGLR